MVTGYPTSDLNNRESDRRWIAADVRSNETGSGLQSVTVIVVYSFPNFVSHPSHTIYLRPGGIFTNPTLIELRQEISQYHWLRGAVTSFSALARSVRQS
ncbi:hypothetical protein AVEN_104696-1 [Araneus ventricosus]|uniref:Uncharacterized protein n=1 Tax=Araneus ventricosus TaxID=182803 RepID=A0A4Y2JZN6_ARAVE|nr:hypothetical protein AVEN_104696-1 [Araneus ventricosus]